MPKLCDAGQPGDEFGRVEQRFVARHHARKLPDDIRLPRQNPSILLFSTRLEPSQKGVSQSLFPKHETPHCFATLWNLSLYARGNILEPPQIGRESCRDRMCVSGTGVQTGACPIWGRGSAGRRIRASRAACRRSTPRSQAAGRYSPSPPKSVDPAIFDPAGALAERGFQILISKG